MTGSRGTKMTVRRTGGLSVPRARYSIAAIALASSLIALGLACVDPKGDYDTYIERTNGVRGVRPDTGPVTEFETGDVDINAGEATYFVSCLPQVFAGSPETSILLYSVVNTTAGKFDFTNYPMKDNATTFLKSETFGDATHGATSVAINSDNTFSVALPGIINIPGKSQRITDNDLQLSNVVFVGKILSTERWCAELNGAVVKPPTDITPPGDFCIYVKLKEGDPLPTFTDTAGKTHVGFASSEYHCP